MRKLSLELPKYRLMLNLHLVKRRKPLVSEPIIPTVARINQKYRKGTLLGKIARYVSDHKSTKKIFAANMAAVVIASTFMPSAKAASFNISPDEVIIEAQTPLNTEKGIQLPLDHLTLNQGFSFFHPGIDMGAEIGDPVKPIKSGVVTFAGFSSDGYGNNIIIDHGKGLESLYAHLSKIEVKVGQVINMNTEIGKVGVSGRSTGPHLHLEIHQNGISINPLTVLSR